MEVREYQESNTPTERVASNQMLPESMSDSCVSVVPCLAESPTDLNEHHLVEQEKEVTCSSFAVPEDPLIDFHLKRKLQRRQKLQEKDNNLFQNPKLAQEHRNEDTSLAQKVPEILAQNETQAKTGIAAESQLPQETLKMWTKIENQPLNFSSCKLKFAVDPCYNVKCLKSDKTKKDVLKNGIFDEDCNGDIHGIQVEGKKDSLKSATNDGLNLQNSVKCKQSEKDADDVNFAEKHAKRDSLNMTQNSSGKTSDNHVNATQDKRVYRMYNFGPNVVVKASKFLLNGETCYVIPAKVLVDQVKQLQSPDSTKRYLVSPSKSIQGLKDLGSSCKDILSMKALKRVKEVQGQLTKQICQTTKRASSSLISSPFLKLSRQPSKECSFFSPDIFFNSMPESKRRRKLSRTYPSIRRYKSNKAGMPRIRISRLRGQSTGTKENGEISKGKGQALESKGKRLDGQGRELEGKFQEGISKSGMDSIESIDNVEVKKSVTAMHCGEKGCRMQDCLTSKKSKEQIQKEDKILKFIIQSPSSGTTFFINSQNDQDQIDADVNGNSNNYTSDFAADQLVPNLEKPRQGCALSTRTQFLSPDPPMQRERSYCQEFRDSLKCLKNLVENGYRMTEFDVILSATFYIKDLERRVKGYLHNLGVDLGVDLDLGDQSLDQIIPEFYRTSFRTIGKKTSRILAVNPNSITTSNACFGTPKKVGYEADFLVPNFLPSNESRRLSPYENSLYLPNSQKTSSPQLSIGGHDIWAHRSSQAHGELALSQESSQSVLHRSSQVSFSDSLTDDSEAVHEFELHFEREASPKKDANKTFQTFVEDLLANCEDFDELNKKDSTERSQDEGACTDQLTPVKNQSSSFEQEMFISPLPTTQPSSPLLFTPPQFSVSNLAYDIPHLNESSVVLNQKTPEATTTTDLPEQSYFYHDLSLTVIGRGNNHVITKDLCQSSTVRRLVPSAVTEPKSQNISSANQDNQLRSCDNEACSPEGPSLLTRIAPKIIMAKDLISSDLLTSFLNPNPVLIPEDPFGMGAETSVGVDDAPNDSWQDGEVTPPQTKRGIAGIPPKLEKKTKGGRKRKNKGATAKASAGKQSKRFCVPTFSTRNTEYEPNNVEYSAVKIGKQFVDDKLGKHTSLSCSRKALETIHLYPK